jgi:hypothetical protein
LVLGLALFVVLGAFDPSYGQAASSDYSHETVTQLIDDLTQIEPESPGISTSAIYVEFVAENRSASDWVGRPGRHSS